jgi:hypothetical protein
MYARIFVAFQYVISIDILYTLDSASNYSAIQKLKPWLQAQVISR